MSSFAGSRVNLAPGETKRVQFELRPEHLMLYDREGKWSIEPGRFTVSVRASSEDLRLRTTFTVTPTDGTAPTEAPVRESKSDPR